MTTFAAARDKQARYVAKGEYKEALAQLDAAIDSAPHSELHHLAVERRELAQRVQETEGGIWGLLATFGVRRLAR